MSTANSRVEENSVESFLSRLVHAEVDFSEVGKRIDEIANLRGLKAGKAFGKEIGVSQSTAWRLRSGVGIEGNWALLLKIADLDPQQRGIYWLLGGDQALRLKSAAHKIGASDIETKGSLKRLQSILRAAKQVARDLEEITGGGKDGD